MYQGITRLFNVQRVFKDVQEICMDVQEVYNSTLCKYIMNQLFPAVAVNCCSPHSIKVQTATTAQY